MLRKPTPAKITKWEKAKKVKKLLEIKQINDEHLCKVAEGAINNVLKSCTHDLYQRDKKAKMKAVKVLGNLKYPQSKSHLRQALRNSGGNIRTRIIWALGELRDGDAVELIKKELFLAKWGINPNPLLRSQAQRALKKIDTMGARLRLSSFENMCKTEQERRRRGEIHTCPLCKTNISPLAIGCHKCKKIFQKRNWLYKDKYNI